MLNKLDEIRASVDEFKKLTKVEEKRLIVLQNGIVEKKNILSELDKDIVDTNTNLNKISETIKGKEDKYQETHKQKMDELSKKEKQANKAIKEYDKMSKDIIILRNELTKKEQEISKKMETLSKKEGEVNLKLRDINIKTQKNVLKHWDDIRELLESKKN